MTVRRAWFPLTGDSTRRSSLATARAVKKPPVDPLGGARIALAGRVVTMNNTFAVRDDAVVYVANSNIVAVQDRNQPAPDDFQGITPLETGGTIFPGLIELHNHLAYNALPLWSPIPKLFNNRGQWPNHKDYRPLVSGPMTVLGTYRNAKGLFPFLAPLVRYVECKCLLGGVTTSQGVKLASNSGIQRFYRGIVRNVEQTDEEDLPEAQSRIPDIDAKDAKSFLARLKKQDSCFLLHLSEGVTEDAQPLSAARKHFLALEVAPGAWALSNVFTGIHSAGLLAPDFDVLASHGSSMVWSPLSNLLLYGGTARVDAAKQSGIAIGLGSDWSPTGSKNLLGEMKVAWLYSQIALNGALSARDVVAMATSNAARILRWDGVLGSVEAGKRADLIVVRGRIDDAYETLIRAKETDLLLVMINGIPRYGASPLMKELDADEEAIRVGGQARHLFLKQETSDPDVAQIPLGKATRQLTDGFHKVAELAKELETPRRAPRKRLLDVMPSGPVWSLALDEISSSGVEMSPRLPFGGPDDFTGPVRAPRTPAANAPKLSTILRSIDVDPLTVADDPNFLARIQAQPNLPDALKANLHTLF